MKPFWLETITLDEDERLAGITVVIDRPYLDAIARHLGYDPSHVRDNMIVRAERGDTELWVRLNRQEAIELRLALGKLCGDEPDYIPEAYWRLTEVDNILDREED